MGVRSCCSLASCVWCEFRTVLRLGHDDTEADRVKGVSGAGVSNRGIGGKQCFKMLKTCSGSLCQFARDCVQR
jgi:hypothetical protein